MQNIENIIIDIKEGKPIIIVDNEASKEQGILFIAGEKINIDTINLMLSSSENQVKLVETLSEKIGKSKIFNNFENNIGIESQKGIKADTLLEEIENATHGNINERKYLPIFSINKKEILEEIDKIEMALELCRLASQKESIVVCEVKNNLEEFSKKNNIKIISIKDFIKFQKKYEELVKIKVIANMPTDSGTFKIVGFENHLDGKEHIALIKGEVKNKENVTMRIHSECFTGDILGSMRCDCGSQLKTAMERIEKQGEGIILYLRQEGRGIGLLNKLDAYNLQEQGVDTLDANLQLGFGADMRDYAVAAQMLKALEVKSVKLLTNNPLKIKGLEEYGIKVEERKEIEIKYNKVNKNYLKTKKERMGHLLKLK